VLCIMSNLRVFIFVMIYNFYEFFVICVFFLIIRLKLFRIYANIIGGSGVWVAI
jgi:hypothetical protein